eukprot:SAG11_NODE_1932_length_4043_cov_4.892748_3_plen_340_part_00
MPLTHHGFAFVQRGAALAEQTALWAGTAGFGGLVLGARFCRWRGLPAARVTLVLCSALALLQATLVAAAAAPPCTASSKHQRQRATDVEAEDGWITLLFCRDPVLRRLALATVAFAAADASGSVVLDGASMGLLGWGAAELAVGGGALRLSANSARYLTPSQRLRPRARCVVAAVVGGVGLLLLGSAAVRLGSHGPMVAGARPLLALRWTGAAWRFGVGLAVLHASTATASNSLRFITASQTLSPPPHTAAPTSSVALGAAHARLCKLIVLAAGPLWGLGAVLALRGGGGSSVGGAFRLLFNLMACLRLLGALLVASLPREALLAEASALGGGRRMGTW